MWKNWDRILEPRIPMYLQKLMFWLVCTALSAVATLGVEAAGPLPWLLTHGWTELLGSSHSMVSMHVMRDSNFLMQAASHIGVCGICLIAVLLVIYRSERRLWSDFATMRRLD